MADRAKIFTNGESQIVQLPESCRFPEGQREVLVCRDGPRVILEPVVDEWSQEFLDVLGAWDEPIELPPSTPITELKDPFE